MPAVSTRRMRLPFHAISMSTASRVVPATSLTIDRLRFARRFVSEDLPTFGLPMIATFSTPSSRSGSGSPSSGSAATTSSSRSPVPKPWPAEMPRGSPTPSE